MNHRPERLEQAFAVAQQHCRKRSNSRQALAEAELNGVEERHNDDGEGHLADQASFQVLSEREVEDGSRWVGVLEPHKVDDDIQVNQIVDNKGVVHVEHRVEVGGNDAAGIRQEISWEPKHCLDDCSQNLEGSQGRLDCWEEEGTAVVGDKIDDDPGPVDSGAGPGYRRKAEGQGATMTWLRLKVRMVV